MSTNITTSIQAVGTTYVIQASINTGSDVPADIFVYQNTGVDSELGDYIGVCSIQQWKSLTLFSPGQSIPVFGNKFVKYSSVRKVIPLSSNPDAVLQNVINDISDFRTKYINFLAPVTKVYTLP